ncbi:sulfotransferase [Rubinisphaera brasiliensis]|uniref:Tetratricopeptide TPR_1 repeat-containing protein n=1 Tax=Rubinisphaera brasiliensis (strain ATCC 49424 / DSM 5305 / JCM 21570 / IAM 15109 / NBRC 103401 / IFAM 1448) TaxID=756272 RepID=F0SQD2_RUBBR|nr:tetratricopeptide repeat-containing sulfotransferase family protein [Rubinisphaera brasiliensis]ADY62311.1 Tetratricopeptide TPR_1 repeat-containing protein [Rubinisphaera brasiliensis DSM 5305]
MHSLAEIIQLTNHGNFEQADQVFLQLSEQDDSNAEVLNIGAIVSLRRRRFQESLQRIDRAIERAQSIAELWNTRGAILLDMRRHKEAFESFSKAAELNPEYKEAIRNRGLPLKHAGHLEAAERCFRETVDSFPDDPQSWTLLSETQFAQKHFSAAIESASQAIKITPASRVAHRLRIRACIDAGLLESGKTFLNDARDQCGDSYEWNELNGTLLRRTGQFEEAIQVFRRMLTSNPDKSSLLIQLCLCLLEQDRPENIEQIKELLRRMQFESGPETASLVELGQNLLEQNQTQLTEQILHRIPAAFREQQIVSILRIRLHTQKQQFQFAHSILSKHLQQHPRSASSDLAEAELAIAEGQPESAIRCLRRLLAEAPTHLRGCQLLSDQLIRSSAAVGAAASAGSPRRLRLEEALLVAQRGLTEVEDEELLFQQAKALHALQKPREAVGILRSLKEFPREAQRLHLMGLCSLDTGEVNNASEYFRQSLTHDAEYAPAHYHLALSNTPKAPQERIRELTDLLNRDNISGQQECLLRVALGRAFDAAKEYERAFFEYQQSNRIKADADDPMAEDRPRDHAYFMSEIAEVFDRDFFRNRTDVGSDTTRPVFIVGLPRSGTTLTEQILASHSAVFGAGELQDVGEWPSRIERLAQSVSATFPGAVKQLSYDQLRSLSLRYERSLNSYSSTATHIVDKMPTNFLHLGLIGLLFPNATIIHCQRAPLDIFVSCVRHGIDWPFSDIDEFGPYYRAYSQLMSHWSEVLPNEILNLHYEELVRSPREQINKLLIHCNLPWEDACMEFNQSERTVITPSRSQVRQPIYTSSVGAWTRYQPQLGPLLSNLQIESTRDS